MDPWLERLWKAIKGALSNMDSDRDRGDSAKEAPDSSISDVQLNLLSLTDHNNCESVKASVASDSEFASSVTSSASVTQTDISDVRPVPLAVSPSSTSQSGSSATKSVPEVETRDVGVPHVSLLASLTCSLPPLSQSSLNVPALPPSYLDVCLQEVDTMEEVRNSTANKTSI